MTIYDFELTLENGETYSLEKYRNQVIIVVNTATKCGLSPQFKALEEIYETYKERGLVVLAFPSNQFKQELKSATEAAEACALTYGVTFPFHELCLVNGNDTLPLFDYLKTQVPGLMGNAIKWNFTKFLIDREGNVVKRYSPKTNPKEMIEEIERLI